MGALIPFLSGADTDLPFARRALDRCQAERAGLKGEVAKLKAMRADLEPKLGVIDQAEHEVDALLNRDAQSLIDRMRSGVEAALDLFGGRARIMDERLAASKHQAEVARRAIVAIDVELERLALVDAELAERERFLIADVIRESAAGLHADYSTSAEHLRDGLVRLTALSRFLTPEVRPNIVPAPGASPWQFQTSSETTGRRPSWHRRAKLSVSRQSSAGMQRPWPWTLARRFQRYQTSTRATTERSIPT